MSLPPIPGLNPALDPLPARFHNLRPHQLPAILDILDAFSSRARVVVLDAPTGTGKTIIAEVVRLALGTRGVYVCHNKDLQFQFASDFPYARIMMGRDNYTPVHQDLFPNVTCGDCEHQLGRMICELCPSGPECPYIRARLEAAKAPVAVLNTAYWLNATLSPETPFARRGLTVIDEIDTLESILGGQVDVSISPNTARKYSIPPPDKLTVEGTYGPWGKLTVESLMSYLRANPEPAGSDPRAVREHLRLTNLLSRVRGMLGDLEAGRKWVYTGGAGSERRGGERVEFRPVEVREHGAERVWGKDRRFLVMSGSVISASMLLEGLGYTDSYSLVTVPSTFPAKNRQMVVRGAADMTRTGQSLGSVERLVGALETILDDHPAERVLVHTVSYDLANKLQHSLARARPIYTYSEARARATTLATFKATPNAVIIAPSMERGIDLPDDLCRVVVVAKVPYPNLADKQVSARLHSTPNGKTWYQVQVARSLLQMTGRAVRHEGDHATIYVLDTAFRGWYRTWQHLLPGWFRAAIRFEGLRNG